MAIQSGTTTDDLAESAGTDQAVSIREAQRLAQMFQLFADATRTRILYTLLQAREMCVNDIASSLGIPETSVSHALRLLRVAGVVRNRRDGRLVYYSLDDEHIRMLLSTSREHLAHRVR
ncbi:MAG TPA: metalloregulator ArsR/SmtB family transcription factor [Actinomycetota bacterium]|nr:metalloregulator ArsR/SmtB family transcription factor [Actinomycetota bacterium]